MKFLSKNNINQTALYLVTITVAFCSIVYELILAHSVSLVAGSAVTWYGLIIGSYLGSLGLGSFFASKLIKTKKLLTAFIQVEFLLVFFGGVSVVMIYFLQVLNTHFIIHGDAFVGKIVFLGGVFLIVFLIGFLSGIELPLLIEGAKKISQKITANRILAADYFGSLFGAITFPLFLVPSFNMFLVSFFIAAVNLFVAILVLFFLTKKNSKGLRFFITQALILLLLLGISFKQVSGVEQYFAKKYYYYPSTHKDLKDMINPMNESPEINRTRSKYQVIDLVQMEVEKQQDVLMSSYKNEACSVDSANSGIELYLNGDWQLNGGTEVVYHEYFAHVPIQLNGKIPENVLVLGGGDGMLDRELLKYSEIKKITQVDLDEKMIELAKNNEILRQINKEAISDKRVEVIIGDGFSFVKNTNEKFDAVYFDFPTPMDYNTSKLYSKEFYSLVRAVLTEDGFIAYDIPAAGSFFSYDKKGKQVYNNSDSPLPSYYATIRSAGFKTVVPFLSRIETDNQKALIVARDYLTKKQLEKNSTEKLEIKNYYLFEKKQELAAREYVQSFAVNIQEGFIFAKNKNIDVNKKFKDNGIQMCLLNKERFLLSLDVSFLPTGEVLDKEVNSIMRPRIPLSKFSQIRLPYYIQ